MLVPQYEPSKHAACVGAKGHRGRLRQPLAREVKAVEATKNPQPIPPTRKTKRGIYPWKKRRSASTPKKSADSFYPHQQPLPSPLQSRFLGRDPQNAFSWERLGGGGVEKGGCSWLSGQDVTWASKSGRQRGSMGQQGTSSRVRPGSKRQYATLDDKGNSEAMATSWQMFAVPCPSPN